MNQITNAISAQASALCEALEDYVHCPEGDFDEPTYNVLMAAALEVSELELILVNGHAERLWWITNPKPAA